MSKKEFKVQDFIDAIEANHIPHKRGGWFDNDSHSKIGAACILGIACINMGVTSNSLTKALNKIESGSSTRMISANDSSPRTYPQLVAMAKEIFEGKENEPLVMDTQFYFSTIKEKSLV